MEKGKGEGEGEGEGRGVVDMSNLPCWVCCPERGRMQECVYRIYDLLGL